MTASPRASEVIKLGSPVCWLICSDTVSTEAGKGFQTRLRRTSGLEADVLRTSCFEPSPAWPGRFEPGLLVTCCLESSCFEAGLLEARCLEPVLEKVAAMRISLETTIKKRMN